METPSEKSQKYDRQLRLWGDRGQTRLEACHLCLINATATGCEILKNLILPGIGTFTIIDDHVVVEEDLGNNFFLTKDSLGQKRGEVATSNLLELNEDVSGNFIDEKLERFLERNPENLLQYTMVIATALSHRTLLTLSKFLWSHDIPLAVCRSYGMVGYLRLVTRDHCIVEAHPEHPHPDLRLTNPFPELVQFCDRIDLDSLTKKDHSHVPWLVVMYKYLQMYKDQHGGNIPKSYKEKTTLKELIRSGIRANEEGVPENEENFDEAIKAVNTALSSPSSSNLEKVLHHQRTNNVTSESQSFWILARALSSFIDTEGQLPLQGSIPDMTADSKSYIDLQQVYLNKASSHVNVIHKAANGIRESVGGPAGDISIEETRTFCKNAAYLDVINCRSLEEEYDPQTTNIQTLVAGLGEDGDSDDTVYYVLLRACELFHAEYSRYPGWYDDQVEADIPLLKGIAMKLLSDAGVTANIREDFIHEICSYGGGELHTIAAYMGGVAAQEVIKLITGQYLPINNTYIYNAASQTSVTLQL